MFDGSWSGVLISRLLVRDSFVGWGGVLCCVERIMTPAAKLFAVNSRTTMIMKDLIK